MTNGNGNGVAIWIGVVGVGASVGLAFVLKQRKRDPWSSARFVSRRMAEGTCELAATTKDIAHRIGIIYEESRKVAEDFGEIWSRGRKLIGV